MILYILLFATAFALVPIAEKLQSNRWVEEEESKLDFTSFKADELDITRKSIKIHTEFVSPEEMEVLYRETGGTADNVLAFSRVLNEEECLIVSVTPENWDDHRSLAMLGHEVLHCLGGEHS